MFSTGRTCPIHSVIYEGVPVLDLPADPPSPDVSALAVLTVSPAALRLVMARHFFRNFCSIQLRSARPSAFRPPDNGTPYA